MATNRQKYKKSSSSSSSSECTSTETSPDDSINEKTATKKNVPSTPIRKEYTEEFINSEFYIDESLPSSYDGDERPHGILYESHPQDDSQTVLMLLQVQNNKL